MSDSTPTAIANQALDAAGVDATLGDLEEGTKEARVCLRWYAQCRQTLLRAAHWNFARAQGPLLLLADASGQTPNVGSIVPVPWFYEYAWPVDCVRLRMIPYNPLGSQSVVPQNNIQLPAVPPTPVSSPLTPGARLIPARFLVTSDPTYPAAPETALAGVPGSGPQSRTVILTNVQQAIAVYTRDVLYPSTWDSTFRQAMVTYLASWIAVRLAGPGREKFGIEMQRVNIQSARTAIQEARVTDGNESGFTNVDHTPDWLASRWSGGLQGWPQGPATGYPYGGWDSVSFADGSSLPAY